MARPKHRYSRVTASLLVVCLALSCSAIAVRPARAEEKPAPSPSAQPGVRIVAPEKDCVVQPGEVVKILLVVTAQDVSGVAVFCDDKGLGMLTAAPYSVDWNTTEIPSGKHLLRAFAYLKSGEKVGAEPVALTVAERQAAPAPNEPAPQPAVIKEGTVVMLRTTESMTSGISTGTAVRYKVARDVLAPDGRVLIAFGADAYGKVTDSRKRGMLGKNGRLSFSVEFAEAVDKTQVPLRAKQSSSGKSNQGVMIASVLLLSVFAVFVNGRDVTVPADTEIAAYVDHDTAIGAAGAPRPGGVPMGGAVESVAIESPISGRKVSPGYKLPVSLKVNPEDKAVGAILIVNDREVGPPVQGVRGLRWDTSGLAAAEYRLQAEVKFQSGLKVRSEPVVVVVQPST